MAMESMFDKSKLIVELRYIHKELVEVYKKVFNYKYMKDERFKSFVDKEFRENDISNEAEKAWNDNYCHRASYTLLNKILFVRICEDKGFMINPEDFIAEEIKDPHIGEKLTKIGLQKWTSLVTNYTFGELIKFAFCDMKKSYNNIILYKENKYDILNPNDEDLSLKYLKGGEELQQLVLKFEDVLSNILEKLDTNNFDFKNTDGNILGDVYEKFMDRETRKAIGQFYTPEFIIEYILKNTVAEVDVVENPFVRIADISCGSGHFLIMTYDILREKFTANIEKLRDKYINEVYKIRREGRIEELKGTKYWVTENIHYHILKNCIYGADIDSFAVQLTTINLLLKDLDNFTDELNIVECDSLMHYEGDYDFQHLKEQLEEEYETIEVKQVNLLGSEENIIITQKKEYFSLKYKDAFGIEKQEYINKKSVDELIRLCEFWDKEFDYVVGNPPYVRQEKISNKIYLGKRYDVYSSIADLLTYFIERGMKKVKLSGKLGMIVSDKFTRTNYGQKLRGFLIQNYTINNYKDEFDSGRQIFEDATVDSAIMILQNKKSSSRNLFVYNNTFYNQEDLSCEGWHFSDEFGMKIKQKMDNLGTKIKNIDDITINYGIKTGLNDAFIINKETREYLCDEDPKSAELIKRIIRGRDINQYEVEWEDSYILFIPWHFPFHEDSSIQGASIKAEEHFKSSYPTVYRYLLKYKNKLSSRNQAETGIRYEWYALQRFAASYYKDFEKEKIIYPNMAIENRFYYDSDGFYSNDKTFILTSDKYNLKYLSGLLNSSLLFCYFRWVTSKLQGETREYRKIFVNEVPLILKSDYEPDIIQMVELLLKKDKNYEGLSLQKFYENEKEKVKLSIAKSKAIIKINQIIYKMYQMLPEEISYVENDINEFITFEKQQYLDDLESKKVEILYDYLSKCENYFIDKLEEVLPVNNFIVEHIENNRTLSQIAKQYGFEHSTVALLRERYADKYNVDQPWKFYNLSIFYKSLKDTILNDIIGILRQNGSCLSPQEIRDYLKEKHENFEEIIYILRSEEILKNSIDIIKQLLNNVGITWDKYISAKGYNKVCDKILKYETNKYYGLVEWSDEIHRKYFMKAIEEYTVNNPDIKKANNNLKLFKDLRIEDKQEYIEVFESKIKRASK